VQDEAVVLQGLADAVRPSALAAAAGTVVATAASLVPVALLAREPLAAALGDEL
jgi:hypothetical protein